MASNWRIPKEDVALIVKEARALIAAHERRSDTSTSATLAEEDAMFRVWFEIDQACIKGRVTA